MELTLARTDIRDMIFLEPADEESEATHRRIDEQTDGRISSDSLIGINDLKLLLAYCGDHDITIKILPKNS
jgi:hypothetical protein